MFSRLGAKAIFVAVAAALVLVGIALIGLAIATSLMPQFGIAGGYAIAGAILLLPPLVWALIVFNAPPAKPQAAPQGGGRELMNSIFTALARETPWAAVAGAGLLGAVNLFLNRNKPKK